MMSVPRLARYDAAIVGGGPAGSAAALMLARAGRRVVILESHRYPRLKPCGNLVSGFATSHLDFDLPAAIVRGEARGALVSYGGHIVRVVTPPFGVFCFRTDLDHFLVDKAVEAGAELQVASTVRALTLNDAPRGPWVTLCTTHGGGVTARYVIGADGANSVVARYVHRRPFKRYERAIGIMALQPRPISDVKREDGDLLSIDLDASATGYGWVFPQGGHQNVGVAGWAPFFRNAKRSFAAFASGRSEGAVEQHGHLLPVGAFRRRVARGPVLLAGDAAGFLNLASGEGIGYAIESGQLAARSILAALTDATTHADAAGTYQRCVARSIARELRAASYLAGLILVLRQFGFALDPIAAEEVFRKLFSAVAGTCTYAELTRFVYGRLPLYVSRRAWHAAAGVLRTRRTPRPAA